MISIDDLVKMVNKYNLGSEDVIRKAYDYASSMHEGQYRQSGEPYIIHPLTVASILADMHADTDTICAGLLHDTLEDTAAKKEEIALLFNDDVANLVDGVTKISKMNFSSKYEQNLANTRKIITGITDDVRIIIIKLADRLHNMRTLQYKSKYKQKENSLETLEIFVPLAYYIGAYRLKSELEDLSLRYLRSDRYKRIEEFKIALEDEHMSILYEMLHNIKDVLDSEEIPNDIKVRTKNIYGIYKKICNGQNISNIHDLLALKVMVDEVTDCYRALGYIHSLYHPVNDKFKDYICNPKTNLYKSLHTTVFGPNERLVQTQIRTFDMDKIASFGLTAYWDINKGNARRVMQEDLREKFQFFKSLVDIDSIFSSDNDFVDRVKNELFAQKIYVYTSGGDIVELPKGSSLIDFAYQVDEKKAHSMVGAVVNDENAPIDYELQNKDIVRIETDEEGSPTKEWIDMAQTSGAKYRIKKYLKEL